MMEEPRSPDHPQEHDPDRTRTVLPSATGDAAPAATPQLREGQRFGAYRIVRRLGRGGMGEVYEAEDLRHGRRVALKTLLRTLAGADDRARFLREGRLAAAVSHPNTVYVYGTEEIDHVPTITMELASGGTLKDRVRTDGPLAPATAVDTIVQVIAGLDAAARQNVLHRDVKPSNCFVALDGSVKIGDFGLSMSTLARDETQLTIAGSVLGTPAFASPEQLRGRALDVRSDIYSVGATLHYLLTGRPPFDDDNILALTAKVVGETAPPVTAVRPGIAPGLARVVTRCLAKDPADRPATHAALAAALAPYGSRAPTPAPLGRRMLAAAIDLLTAALVTVGLAIPFITRVVADPSVAAAVPPLAGAAAEIVPLALYFGLLEGLWGTSLGKAALGLRVVAIDGSSPGMARAGWRALVFALLWHLPEHLSVLLLGTAGTQAPDQGALVGVGVAGGALAGIAVMWSTMRRHNGLRGLHEFASRTRVVTTPRRDTRPVLVAAGPVLRPPADAPTIGDYAIVDTANEPVVRGYDPKLQRPVWIHRPPPGTPAVPAPRRNASRAGRPRWLAGRREPGATWDVYEAFAGGPLRDVARRPVPWAAVRHWLADLAAEIDAATRDGTRPPLGLDHVWITPDGRARLLDWPAPRDAAAASPAPSSPPAATTEADRSSGQRFLARVSAWCLAEADADGHDHGLVAVPLRAQGVLARLGDGAFPSTEAMVAGLAALADGPALVSRRERALHLVACGFPPLFVTAVLFALAVLIPRLAPDVGAEIELTTALDELADLRAAEPRHPAVMAARRVLERRIARHLRVLTARGVGLSDLEQRDDWPLIEPLLTSPPGLRPDEPDADATLALGGDGVILSRFLGRAVPRMIAGWLVVAAVIGPLTAVVFRGGLLLRLLGVAVATGRGREASRLRIAGRALVAWLPAIIGAGLGFHAYLTPSAPGPSIPVLFWTAVAVLVGGAAYALVRPHRGVQDRIAGTALVPR